MIRRRAGAIPFPPNGINTPERREVSEAGGEGEGQSGRERFDGRTLELEEDVWG